MQKDILQWNKQTSFRSKIHGLKLLVFLVLMQCNEILKNSHMMIKLVSSKRFKHSSTYTSIKVTAHKQDLRQKSQISLLHVRKKKNKNPIRLSTFWIEDAAQLKKAQTPSSTHLGMVMFSYNTSTWKVESRWSQVQEQSKLQRVRDPFSKKIIQKRKTNKKQRKGGRKDHTSTLKYSVYMANIKLVVYEREKISRYLFWGLKGKGINSFYL